MPNSKSSSAKARVLMVLDHPFPPDVRVENEARALIESGYEVAVLSIGPDQRPAAENVDGILVYRSRISRQRRNKMRGLAGTIPFLTRYVARHVRAVHKTFPCDILHVHDLYLFGGGLRAGRDLGIAVVGDLHENWVEALRGYAWSSRMPGRLFISLRRWQRLETEWTRQVDRLVVVVEEAAGRHIANGVPSERIVVVSNSLNIESFDAHPLDTSLVAELRSSLHIVYVGGVDLHRGLDTAVDAFPRVLREFPDASMTLVGDGRTLGELKDRVRRVGIEDSVRFTGWQPQALLKSYISSADICLVPHRRTPHTDATIPHKLFQYMYYAKPVIVSDCAPLKRIVRETGAGLVFKASDASSLASCITSLAADPDAMKLMGARGREAVISRFNWDVEARKLITAYDELMSESSGGTIDCGEPGAAPDRVG